MFNDTDAGPWEAYHTHAEPCRRCGKLCDWWLCEDCDWQLENSDEIDDQIAFLEYVQE